MTAHARILLLVAAVVAAGPPAFAAEGPGEPSRASRTRADIPMAPVEIDGRVLFEVRGASALPAAVRAARIRERIETLAADPSFQTEQLRVETSGAYARIMAADRAVVALVDADARPMQVGLTVLADLYRQRIIQAIEEYREARRPDALRRDGLAVLAGSVGLALIIIVVLWSARRLDARLERRFRRRIEALEIQSFELVRREQVKAVVRNLLRGFRTLALLVVAFLYAYFALSRFPWTRAFAAQLMQLVIVPLSTMGRAILANVPNLIFLIVLFVVIRFVLRMMHLFFDAVARGSVTLIGFDPEWAVPTYKIARVAVIAFGLVVAYPYIPGSESAAFKGISLFLGVVFSLGSSSAISNIIAGYTMTYRRAFKVGDRIKIGETVGDVIETRLQVTHLRSLKNEEVIIPNSQILNSEIVNYSSLVKEEGLILHTTVGIGYETPWRQVEALLLMAAARTPGVLTDPPPFVLHRKLADFAVEYEINAYCRDAHAMLPLYTALHRNILDVFNEYGVQIMTPAYERDPEQRKVVPREQWYAPPARTDARDAK
jgi:small-conductance mechanosensitive channel